MISHIDFTKRGVAIDRQQQQKPARNIFSSKNHWPSYQTLIHCLPPYLHLLHSNRTDRARARTNTHTHTLCIQKHSVQYDIFVCALADIDNVCRHSNSTNFYFVLHSIGKKVFICKWLNHHHPHCSLYIVRCDYSMEIGKDAETNSKTKIATDSYSCACRLCVYWLPLHNSPFGAFFCTSFVWFCALAQFIEEQP